MARKKPVYTYDRANKRWRKGGKWAKPPKAGDLARDALGRYLDGSGRLVPKAAVQAPPAKKPKAKAKKPAPKPKAAKKKPGKTRPKAAKKKPGKTRPKAAKRSRAPKAPKTPRKRAPALSRRPERKGAVRYVDEGQAFTAHNLISSSFQNKLPPERLEQVFKGYIERACFNNRVGIDDVTIYRHGIQFILTHGSGNLELLEHLVERFSTDFPQYTYHYSEGILHVLAGRDERPMSAAGVEKSLNRSKRDFSAMWDYLYDLWDGDIGWFVEVETDELEGGS